MRSTVNTTPTKTQAEQFVSKAGLTWNEKLNDRQRMVASNALFLYSRAGSLDWDWDRFQMEYIVFDSACSLSGDKSSTGPHGKRFLAMCDRYGLKYSRDLMKRFVGLRNDLFHEALWDLVQPTTARSSESLYASFNLRRFNHRLLTAILSGPSEYTSSAWWYLGTAAFKL